MMYNVHFIIFCVILTCSCFGAGSGNELSIFRRKRQNIVNSELSVFDMNRAESLQSSAPGNIRVFRKRFFQIILFYRVSDVIRFDPYLYAAIMEIPSLLVHSDTIICINGYDSRL